MKNKGCTIRKFNWLVKDIWDYCTEEDIFLPPVQIPRKENNNADFMSRKYNDNAKWFSLIFNF